MERAIGTVKPRSGDAMVAPPRADRMKAAGRNEGSEAWGWVDFFLMPSEKAGNQSSPLRIDGHLRCPFSGVLPFTPRLTPVHGFGLRPHLAPTLVVGLPSYHRFAV